MSEQNQNTKKPPQSRIVKLAFLAVAIGIAVWIMRGQQEPEELPAIWSKDLDGTLKTAAKERRHVAVFFMTRRQDVTTKRMITKSIGSGEGVTNQLKRHDYLAAIGIVDQALKSERAKKYEIKELPTLLVLSPRGKILGRKTGFVGHAEVTGFLATCKTKK